MRRSPIHVARDVNSPWLFSVVVGSALLGAGCQLLLVEDDGSGARGGAGTSSSDATTSGKTSSSSKASTTGVTSSTDASSASSGPGGTTSASGSSSSGGNMCSPSGIACAGLGSSSLPSGCPPTITCGGNAGCSSYCSAMKSMCPEQWESDATCCTACAYFQSKTHASQCCHVDPLNVLAAMAGDASSCTQAGPFGSLVMTDSPCGTQANNLCDIYAQVCPNQQNVCGKSQCVEHFMGAEAVEQYAANANGDPLSQAMDALLSGDPTTCATLASQFCAVMTP